MIIEREKYLNKIIRHKNNGLIKVITGMRRVGKSYLLFKLFYDYLINTGVKKEYIITFALDDRRNKNLRDPDNLLKEIDKKIIEGNMYYILLDEIQMVSEFEDVLNSLLHIRNVDIYVTGSNSKFLSRDLITEFRGRSDEIRVYPLTFKEFISAYDGDKQSAWNQYYTYGGLPLTLYFENHEEKSEYLVNQFNKVYISDIIERNKIRNTEEIEELINILSSNIGSLTNPKKLANTFKSVKGINISEPTLKKYLQHLEDSFLVEKAVRYNVKGKKYISTPSKYYFADLGLRNGRLNFRQQEENHIMENIIYNELRVRGYNVDVGVVEIRERVDNSNLRKQLEVDFIATKGNKKYYIQSAYQMSSKEKRTQEEKSLLNINDSFKKIIIVKDSIMPKRDDLGVVTISLFDFLLEEVSLDF